MFLVEIGLADADRLVETSDAMRAWFDERGLAPLTFGYSLTASRTLFRVEFANEGQAVAFSKAFQGIIIEHPPTPRAA